MTDAVHPSHYRNEEGVQLIEVVRLLPFSLGNAVKYVYRHERKGRPLEDLEKALWYVEDFLTHPQVLTRSEEGLSSATVEAVLPGGEAETVELILLMLSLYEDTVQESATKAFTGELLLLRLQERCEHLRRERDKS